MVHRATLSLSKPHSALMLHVEDVLFVGKRRFWEEQFVPKLKEQFSVVHQFWKLKGAQFPF